MISETDCPGDVVSMRSPVKVLKHLLCASVVLFLCMMIVIPAVATAGEIVVDTTSMSTDGGVTTIPVYLSGADDILSFAAEVSNNQPGVTVTISETMQSESGMTVTNSNPTNTVQRVAWISTAGVTADKMLMFAIEITVTDPAVTSVPLEITLTEIASDEKGMLPVSNYPVSSSNFKISDTISGSASSGESIKPAPETPVKPQQPDNIPETSEQPEIEPPVSPGNQDVVPEIPDNTESTPSAETPQSPGFSLFIMLSSLAAAGLISRSKI